MTLSTCVAMLALTCPGRFQAPDSVLALVGVHVPSMRSPEVLRNQTVVVQNGVIASVGPANRAAIPPGARRISAQGRYLMPGLADFHTHVAERGDLALYLVSGVTTIANMGSPGMALIAWRDSIRAGTMSGPEVYVGYYVNGPTGPGGESTPGDGQSRNSRGVCGWVDA
jgi:imidazolonepropionase-like amidohydrolase